MFEDGGVEKWHNGLCGERHNGALSTTRTQKRAEGADNTLKMKINVSCVSSNSLAKKRSRVCSTSSLQTRKYLIQIGLHATGGKTAGV